MTCRIVIGALLGMSFATAPAFAENVRIWVRTSSAPVVEALANDYNEDHDDTIEVVPVVAEQMVPKLGAAMAGGVAPAAVAMDLIYMPTFAEAGMLTDMTDFIDGLSFSDALSPSHIRLGTYDGKKYGVPLMPDASAIAYNKTLFEEAGVDPEQAFSSLAAMKDAAIKIGDLGDDIYGIHFVANSGSWMVYDFMPHVWAAGADVLTDDGREQTVDTPAMRESLQLYNDMWEAGAVNPASRSGNGTSAVEAFASGKVGILMSGSYIVNLLTENYPDIDFGIAGIPGPEGGVSTFAGGDAMVLTSGISDGDKEIVLDFIDYYLQPEQQVRITELAGMPSRTDLADQAYADLDPRNLIVYDLLPDGRTPYTYANDALFVSLTGPWMQMLQTGIFDGDVETAVTTAAEQFQAILDRTNP